MNDESVQIEASENTEDVNENSDANRRTCWVCFASDEDDPTALWIHPCKCRGHSKWVHQNCLQRWVDEKQSRQGTVAVACSACNTEYIIVYPKLGIFVHILDTIANVNYKICPLIAAGIFVGSIYWTAVSYGAVTVMQVVGHRDALLAMEAADPIVLLVGLPTIPFMLIAGKLIKWEDAVLTLLRKYSPKLPFVRYMLPLFMTENEAENRGSDFPPLASSHSSTSILCSALLLPTIATFCGKLFFDSVSNNLHRTLLGGITFITVKGVLNIYYKQQKLVRKSQRKILNYETNEFTSTSTGTSIDNRSEPAGGNNSGRTQTVNIPSNDAMFDPADWNS
ncbi:unnamed protein product [Bemisia tabaci]|uniref:E3 ubiquitin-protein ligase MARCHF5 n=1 Tax=Bemisia tabaci TaxID=7038 RepID=A0A9P0AQP6_BEMTA|nr:unnamed protein product [Bemisia tabaci]